MIYGSVCSGIEAATAAWHPLGWRPAFFSEIEQFPREVLAHHYPDIPCHGDFTTIGADEYGSIDLLVGGTPCQSFSIAGLRGGLDDDRGNLALEFLKLAQRTRPKWIVWENVPGVLSSNRGRDFGTFIGALGEIGYGFAYRVLDAQYFGVAQRRRRVFVVGYLGDWRRAAAVLFERESLSGNPPPSREARKETTGYTSCSFGKYSEGTGTLRASVGDLGGGSETIVTVTARMRGFGDYECDGTASALKARDYKDATDLVAFSSKDYGADALYDLSPTIRAGSHDRSHANGGIPPAVAFAQNSRNELREMDISGALSSGGGKPGQGYQAVRQGMAVRRLTPVECERLQGFPDGFTQIPYRNKPAEKCPDGPRYKALGNSMAVPVMRWIGERIQIMDTCK